MFTRLQLLRALLRSLPLSIGRPSHVRESIIGTPIVMAIIALTSASCDPGCGLFGSKKECAETKFNRITAIRLSMTISAREFDIADGMVVRVIARNASDKSATIQNQTCSRPFYVYAPGTGGIPLADESRICDGDFIAGATLAPGDSIVWAADIRTEIKNNGKDLPSGSYIVRGRVKYGNQVLRTPGESVTIAGRNP